MRQIFFFLLAISLLTSCMDLAMDVEVENTGAITYSGTVDLSSTMPMLRMAATMSDSTQENDLFSELLLGEEPVDTIVRFGELAQLPDSIREEMEDLADRFFKMRILVDHDQEIYRMNFHTKYEDFKDQKAFFEKFSAIIKDQSLESEMLGGFLIWDLDLEEGVVVFRSELKESVEGEAEISFGGDDLMKSSFTINLTLPGKVKKVEGAEFKKIDDWRISLKVPFETDDPAKEFTKIHFEPRSVFSKPQVTEVWDPKPTKINFEGKFGAPTDAIILLGENGTGAWTHLNGNDAQWDFENGVMTVKPGTGDIMTKESFGDCQLHIEWRTPVEPDRKGQGKGNSGIYLQSKYEVQVLDSYKNSTYPNGQAGSIYKQAIPAVNASKAPGEWQTYDIIYKAPRFNKLGMKDETAKITVIHNGVLIHNEQEIMGTTENIGLPKNRVHGDAPLKLQDHSNKVSYRNIWIRKL